MAEGVQDALVRQDAVAGYQVFPRCRQSAHLVSPV